MNQRSNNPTEDTSESEIGFLDSWFQKTFSWFADNAIKGILGVALGALVAWFSNVLNQKEINEAKVKVEQATIILKAKSDYDIGFNLVRQISSHRSEVSEEEKKAYADLLDHLTGNADFDPSLSKTLRTYIDGVRKPDTTQEGGSQNPTTEVRAQTVNNIKSILGGNTSDAALPNRLYIQIATEAQRPTYEAIAKSFQNFERVRVPAVEVVGTKAPVQSDLRYCPSTKQEVAQAVRQQIETVIGRVILRQLPETLCRTVRQNNLELWISKGATK